MSALTRALLSTPTGAINNALGITLTATEVSAIFPQAKNTKGLRSIDINALQSALAAHGVTIDPLRDIILRVFGDEYEQRLKEIDMICGEELNLAARLKALQEAEDKSGKKTAPVAHTLRLPRAKPAAGKRRSGARKPKPKAHEEKRAVSPEVEDQPETDDEDARGDDAMSDDETEVVASVAEDVAWVHTWLVAEAALLEAKHDQECMRSLIPYLRARPLFDKVIRTTQAPTFVPPAWLLQPGHEAHLAWWNWVVAKVTTAELAGARVVGFEVVLELPDQAARVLFACFGEVACVSDGSSGRHAILSYVDSDRGVLPDSTPSNVSAAINRAFMLAMVVKLFRCGASWLWLSACSPEWWWCKATNKIYPDHYCVATSGRKYGKDGPRALKRNEVDAMMAKAKADRDAKLRDVVYPALLERGQRFGIMGHGAGKWAATPEAGVDTPFFVDDVYTKRALQPYQEDHAPAPPGNYQPSFLDAELAASNAAAQIFTAQLKAPDIRLSAHAQRFAEQYVQPAHEAAHCAWRAQQLEKECDQAMVLRRMPRGYLTLGELARHKLRKAYLAMQKGPLAT